MKTAIKGILLLVLTLFALPALATETIEGIGIALANANNQFVVHEVFSGSPAERAGVHNNDIITAVDGQSITGKSLKEVVKVIRGPAGSHVTVTLSDSAGHLRDAQIIREKFTVSGSCFIEGNVLLNLFSSGTTTSVSGNVGGTPVSGTGLGTSLNLSINGQIFFMTLTETGSINTITGNIRGSFVNWQGSGTFISGYQTCVP